MTQQPGFLAPYPFRLSLSSSLGHGAQMNGFVYGGVFYLLLRRRVAASRAFLAPNPAAPEAAPKAKAFPPAIIAGSMAARGKMPPFWRRVFFFLLLPTVVRLLLGMFRMQMRILGVFLVFVFFLQGILD